jgi:hypothetical protein
VVINNHDYGRFVGAAIGRARQSHHDVEVVVVDGSTDESTRHRRLCGRAAIVLQPWASGGL